MDPERPTLVRIFFCFLRLGFSAFGGPAMVEYIRTMAVKREGWLDDAAFKDGVSLCQMVPGATAMQVAAYVGLRVRGLAGAIASFTGFGFPAFVIMLIFSALYVQMTVLPALNPIFQGLRAIVVAIVAGAFLTLPVRR